jgi:uncharacterized RDD family membrane protein YckC
MKCDKCGNEYPSFYYFATENICKECYNKMPLEEQAEHKVIIYDNYNNYGNPEYAYRTPFSLRLGAAILDLLFNMIILMIVLFSTHTIQNYMPLMREMLVNRSLMNDFIGEVMPFAFIVLFMYYSLEIVMSASIGKMVLGLQIAGDDRSKANYNKLAVRFIFKHLDSIISVVGFYFVSTLLDTLSTLTWLAIFVGCFFVLNPKRQAFHDMIAKTAVYRRIDIIQEDNNISNQAKNV